MCTSGSSRGRSTPANARRTGNPSPSNPDGAVVTEVTLRSAVVTSGSATRGRMRMLSVLIAGMAGLLGLGASITTFETSIIPNGPWHPPPARSLAYHGQSRARGTSDDRGTDTVTQLRHGRGG